MKNTPSFTIIGGGIAGLTTAIALARLGLPTSVFESSPACTPSGAGLVLAANAMQTFDRLGIADAVITKGRPLDAFSIMDEAGHIITSTDSRAVSERFGLDNFAIHRADLHAVLLSQLPAATLHTGKRAIRTDQHSEGVTVHFDDGTTHRTDYLLVADGIHSSIRQQLVPGSAPRYAGYTCWRAVVHRPDLPRFEATESWGRQGRVGIVPLTDDRLYWFACVNTTAKNERMRLMSAAELARHFGHYHLPIPDLLAQTPDTNLLWNDIIDLKPLPRFAYGRVLLLGDAAHATTPNLGQGACQAIEDAAVLGEVLARNNPAELAFREFEERRLSRTRTITNNSRHLGRVAQWSNPLLVSLRNGLFRLLPPTVNERQLEMLYSVDF